MVIRKDNMIISKIFVKFLVFFEKRYNDMPPAYCLQITPIFTLPWQINPLMVEVDNCCVFSIFSFKNKNSIVGR